MEVTKQGLIPGYKLLIQKTNALQDLRKLLEGWRRV